MNEILNLSLVYSSIRLTTPLLLAALGGLYAERAGVINIALEGLMLAGAFTAASITYYAGSPWVGLFAGALAGGYDHFPRPRKARRPPAPQGYLAGGG